MAKQHHMTTKYGGLSGDFSAKIESLKNGIDETINKAVLTLFEGVVKDTPADKGTAISNWRISTETNNETYNAFVPGASASTASVNIDATIALGKKSIPRQWSKIYIINNLPYMVPLEYGHSQQISAGFIRKRVDTFKETLKEIANEELK